VTTSSHNPTSLYNLVCIFRPNSLPVKSLHGRELNYGLEPGNLFEGSSISLCAALGFVIDGNRVGDPVFPKGDGHGIGSVVGVQLL